MTTAEQLARSAGQDWGRSRATTDEIQELLDQTRVEDWNELRIKRGHSMVDVLDELLALMASDQLERPLGQMNFVRWEEGSDEQVLARTPILVAFIEGALEGFAEDAD